MISYEILGKVTARRESQSLPLPSQQQLLLARLVWARGAAVAQRELTRAVWDQGAVPAGGLKSAIYELRSSLRKALAAGDILVRDGVAYRLLLDGQQVDAFRFAARLEQAGNSAGAKVPQLAHEALKEWGPQASGLYGGHPLQGLQGGWARGMRRTLRAQYRDVIIGELRRDAEVGDWDSLLRQCARLAAEDQEDPDRKAPQDAMTDIGFLELWMRAAYRSGQPDLAEQVLRNAGEIATRYGRPVSDDLARRAKRLRNEALLPGAAPGAAAAAYPMSPASDRRAMSEPTISFNNNAGSVVNGQLGIIHGGVTIGLAPRKSEDVCPEFGEARGSAGGSMDE